MKDYFLFNQRVRSEISLPYVPLYPDSLPDKSSVYISFGEVSLDGLSLAQRVYPLYQINQQQYWLNIPGVARFLIQNGKEIIITPTATTDEKTLQTFLFHVCFAILLKQQNHVVMPGFAFQYENIAFSFCLSSHTAASLLPLLFAKEHYALLSALFFALDNKVSVLPGLAHFELSPSLAKHVNYPCNDALKIRPESDLYRYPAKTYCEQSLPFKAMYFLVPSKEEQVSFSPLDKAQKILFLSKHALAQTIFQGILDDELISQAYQSIAETSAIIAINTPAQYPLTSLVKAIRHHLKSIEEGVHDVPL